MSARAPIRYLGMFTGQRARRAWAITQACRRMAGTGCLSRANDLKDLRELADGILLYVDGDEADE